MSSIVTATLDTFDTANATKASRRSNNKKRPLPETNFVSTIVPLTSLKAAKTRASETCSLSELKSASKDSKKVRFDSVAIKHYPRALGDFDESNNVPLDYALSLDWASNDDENAAPTILPLDVYENSRTPTCKSPIEYDDLGRLNATQRCARLLENMPVSALAQQVGQRNGKSTARGIGRIEQELETFLKLSASSPTALPPFVTKR
ncbi:hypothetical protein MPSEU_000178800 [Mayamaea pseudoterrestris]|nr:hypothetical protein MPSEU_000178800 [Mayamaea pseudoterrestris]